MIYDVTQKTIYNILTNNDMEVHFMNGLNDKKSAWNWKKNYFEKCDRFAFQLFDVTIRRGIMKWRSVNLNHTFLKLLYILNELSKSYDFLHTYYFTLQSTTVIFP